MIQYLSSVILIQAIILDLYHTTEFQIGVVFSLLVEKDLRMELSTVILHYLIFFLQQINPISLLFLHSLNQLNTVHWLHLEIWTGLVSYSIFSIDKLHNSILLDYLMRHAYRIALPQNVILNQTEVIDFEQIIVSRFYYCNGLEVLTFENICRIHRRLLQAREVVQRHHQ